MLSPPLHGVMSLRAAFCQARPPVSTVTAAISTAVLIGAQTPDGAFPAGTAHDVYRYAWLRDGSWCAYALDRVGRRDAAAAWHGGSPGPWSLTRTGSRKRSPLCRPAGSIRG